MSTAVKIPPALLPADGRFGSGPSKLRKAQAESLLAPGSPLGQSHRSESVKSVVGSIQEGMRELFSLPEGYEIILGNGGAALVWDAIAFNLLSSRAQAAVCGEFSAKAAQALRRVPWLKELEVIEEPPGSLAQCHERSNTENPPDIYLYAENETSTGVLCPLEGFGGHDALTLVDATSSAGAVNSDISAVDFYYFSPQKCFGSDGGLWFALASPAALERIKKIAAEENSAGRFIPDILNLHLAVENSRKAQTFNTPSVANLLLVANQVAWMLEKGGRQAMAERTQAASSTIYSWAEEREWARPFVHRPEERSSLVCTIDIDESIDAGILREELRANGILDVAPYRSLKRNQLRIGVFPNVEFSDVEALLACVDWLVAHGNSRVG